MECFFHFQFIPTNRNLFKAFLLIFFFQIPINICIFSHLYCDDVTDSILFNGYNNNVRRKLVFVYYTEQIDTFMVKQVEEQ